MAAGLQMPSVLDIKAKAPLAVPQPAVPTGGGPAQTNLSGVPTPRLQPPAPVFNAELPDAETTTSLDLPTSLQGLLGAQSPQVTINEQAIMPIPTGTTAMNQQFPALDFRMQPSYADGGQIGMDGQPIRPAGINPQQTQAGGNMSPEMLEMQLQDFMRKNPQAVAQIQKAIMAGFQSGELTPEELNQAGQLAQVAAQNPDMYPYVRKFAIQQGIATEQDIPVQYDQGLVFVLILAVRSAQQMTQQMGMGGSMGTVPQAPAQPAMPAMRNGGEITSRTGTAGGGKVDGPGTGRSDSVTIRASAGEYVIPEHVVRAKGTDFFDKLLEQYQSAPKDSE